MINLDPEKKNGLPKIKKIFGRVSVTQVFVLFCFFNYALKTILSFELKKRKIETKTREVHIIQSPTL